jgi:hypothetical protein
MVFRSEILSALLLSVLHGSIACSDSPQGPGGWIPQEPDNPLPSGDRLWGVTITESVDGFVPSFAVAQQSGIQVIELNIPWDYIETEPGIYQDPYDGALAATAFFAMNDVEVSLSIAVVNTVCRCTPDYLDSLQLSSPEVISAFEGVVDYVMSQVPGDVVVPGISIGNEIDLVLDDYEDWVDYITFFAAAADYVHSGWPGIEVGGKCTVMNGVLGPDLEYVQTLNQYADVVMLTYYPQAGACEVLDPASVHGHLDQIVAAFPGRTVWLSEVGYQSGSEYCGSSEEKQASFYHEFFTAWDSHAPEIELAIVDWLHDISPETLEELLAYYGLSDPGFVEYLATLGLRNYDGTDKYAWLQVLEETSAMGWQR